MDNDILSLIQYLLASPFPSLEDMEKMAGVTRRQSLYRFEKLNRILKGEDVPAVTFSSTPDKKILVAKETHDAFQRLLQKSDSKESYFFSREERLIRQKEQEAMYGFQRRLAVYYGLEEENIRITWQDD